MLLDTYRVASRKHVRQPELAFFPPAPPGFQYASVVATKFTRIRGTPRRQLKLPDQSVFPATPTPPIGFQYASLVPTRFIRTSITKRRFFKPLELGVYPGTPSLAVVAALAAPSKIRYRKPPPREITFTALILSIPVTLSVVSPYPSFETKVIVRARKTKRRFITVPGIPPPVVGVAPPAPFGEIFDYSSGSRKKILRVYDYSSGAKKEIVAIYDYSSGSKKRII